MQDKWCFDCKQEEPLNFIVANWIWKKIAKTVKILCIDCFEKRLGRKLTDKELIVKPFKLSSWDVFINKEMK